MKHSTTLKDWVLIFLKDSIVEPHFDPVLVNINACEATNSVANETMKGHEGDGLLRVAKFSLAPGGA